MRTTKQRIFSFFLAILMVTGMAVPALADVFALVESVPDPEAPEPLAASTPDGGLTVEVRYGDNAGIPAGSTLEVRPIDGEEANQYVESALSAVGGGKAVLSRFVDISILSPDGEEIHPAEGEYVVLIGGAEMAPEGATLHVVHFEEKITSSADAGEELYAEEDEPLASIDRKALRGAGLKAGKITLNSEADGLAAVRGSEIEEEFFDDVVENTVEEDNLPAENEIELNPVEIKDVNQVGGMIAFVTPGFSVFGLIYTVDFEYSVDGKMYQFSLPGGGFVSFTQLVEVLGIFGDTNTDENGDENGSAITENAEGNAANEGVEENDVNSDTYAPLTLGDVEVGEVTRKFVADVASVEFSSPSLVDVSKIENESTVGQIKENRGLECEYSAELTEEQIAEINAQTVKAGDWALISMSPFTSEETLKVTMKDGEVFTIQVTDAQIKKTVIDAKGETWEITVTYGLEAGIPDGAELMVEEILPEDEEYQGYYQQSFEKIGVSTPIEKAGVREAIVASTTDGITGDIESVNDIIEITDAEVESDESAIKPVSDYARIFNIEIWAGDQKVEPAADVTVNIKLLDAPEETEATPQVVHFAKEGAELMQLKEPFENSEDEGIRFVTDEFSVYSVVYTVDFSYEVNGKVYGFTMNGEDSVSLRALIEALHVYEKTADVGKKSDNDKGTEDSVTSEDLAESTPDQNNIEDIRALNDFMSVIKSVRFSDPELLTIVHADEDTTLGKLKADNDIIQQFSLWHPQKEVIERNAESYSAGDWVLVSLRPFDTKEELTIDLITGERFTIQVTDAQNAVMNPDGTVQTISNPAGTTIDLFDYWVDTELRYNDGRSAWPGYYDGWNPSASQLGGTGNEAGINYGHALKFSPAWEHTVINGTNGTHNTNGANGLNSYTGGTSPFQGIVQNQLSNGYPILSTNEMIGTDGESLAYLFNPAVSNGYRASYTDVNQFLYVDKDGYYTFDSRDYYARFHEDTSTFSVTEQTSSDSTIRGFWPFSEYGQRNFWLGMHVNTQFSMPTGGQVLNPSNELKPMQFEFSGDDDVWIYIDGVLVGDAGGIHNRTEVDINFQTGLVTITNSESKYLDDLFRQAGKYDDYEWNGHTLKDGTYHTFDFFYLERGGEESNLYIHYNLVSTADFTAHKSFHGTNEEDHLERDQFQFELIGLDGRYRSVWNEDADAYVLQQEDSTTKAIMPHATVGGTGTVASPSYNPATHTIVNGQTVSSQTYITGVTEDGNINFGTADISKQDMHDADENNPPVYKYIIREIVPADAVNEAGITWADADEEVRAAGGFVKDDIIYDGTIYYMTGRVTSWTETGSDGQPVTKHGLAKVYYTDDTYTTVREDTPFISFVNYFNAKHGNVEFTKVDEIGEGLAGATFGLFRDDACQIPSKMIDVDNSPWTATSDADGHVSFENVRTGTYYMKETEAPEGYALNDTVYKVVIEDAMDPSVSSKITILNNTQTQVTEIINTEAGKLKIVKKWLSSTGTEISGGTHSANVHLYRKTDNSQVPGSCTVSIVFHRSGAGWNLDTGTNGNVVVVEDASSFDLTWHLGNDASHQLSNMRINGVSYSNAQNQVVDTGAGKVNWNPWNGSTSIMAVSDIRSDMYIEFDSNCDWFSTKPAVSNRVPFVPPVIDTTPVLVDTITLSPSNNWNVIKQIGGTLADHEQEGYDLPATDNNGNRYLYYIVELNENRSEIRIGENPLEGYFLQGYSVNNNTGVANQGVLIVYNQMETPPSTNITIKKVDINHLDETNPDFLKGAAFKLTKYTDATFRSIDTGWAEEGSKTLTDARNEDGTFTLNGIFEFQEIPVGYYILEETQYPDGYIKIMDNPAFQIQPKEAGNGLEIVQLVKGSGEEYQNGSTDTIRIENNTAIVYVANTPGAALPNTGGTGIRIFSILGTILILGTGVLLRRRKEN